jgi:hypothetical protein
MRFKLTNEQEQIVRAVRNFVEREVMAVATELEHRDEYPHALVERMKELAYGDGAGSRSGFDAYSRRIRLRERFTRRTLLP